MSRVKKVIENAKKNLSLGAEKIDVVDTVTRILGDATKKSIATFSTSAPYLMLDAAEKSEKVGADEVNELKEIYSRQVAEAIHILAGSDSKYEKAVTSLKKRILANGVYNQSDIDFVLDKADNRVQVLTGLVILEVEFDKDKKNYLEATLNAALVEIAMQYKNGLKVIDALAGYFIAPPDDNGVDRDTVISALEDEIASIVLSIIIGGCGD